MKSFLVEVSGGLFDNHAGKAVKATAIAAEENLPHEEINRKNINAALARRYDRTETPVARRLIALPTLERGRVEFGYWGTDTLTGKLGQIMLPDFQQIQAQLIHDEITIAGLSPAQQKLVARLDRQTYSGPGDTDAPPVMFGGRPLGQRKYHRK